MTTKKTFGDIEIGDMFDRQGVRWVKIADSYAIATVCYNNDYNPGDKQCIMDCVEIEPLFLGSHPNQTLAVDFQGEIFLSDLAAEKIIKKIMDYPLITASLDDIIEGQTMPMPKVKDILGEPYGG